MLASWASAYPPVSVRRIAETSAPLSSLSAVYVFDFTQNIAGWVKLRITGTAGTTVTLRHAEALQHPPYGPRDGNIYVSARRHIFY